MITRFLAPVTVLVLAAFAVACSDDTDIADDDDDFLAFGDDDDDLFGDDDDDFIGDDDDDDAGDDDDDMSMPCDGCGAGERCLEHPARDLECVTDCPRARTCGEDICCPLGSTCNRRGDGCAYGNLTIDPRALENSFDFRTQRFDPDSCAWAEGCVDDVGERRLLRFDLRTPNDGDHDVVLGDPEQAIDLFEYSECHDHYHFLTYAEYELRTLDGEIAATGHKQSFCLIDIERFRDDAGPAQYDCEVQGISAGWADVYGKSLDCQWVDVTGVPAGDYRLRVEINTEQVLAETDYDDNLVEVPVTID